MNTCFSTIFLLLIGVFDVLPLFGQDTLLSEGTRPGRIELSGCDEKLSAKFSGKIYEAQELEDQVRRVAAALWSYGYASHEEHRETMNDTVLVAFNCGTKYRWKNLAMDDETRWVLAKSGSNTERLLRSNFSYWSLSASIEKALIYLENNGFPFAEFRMDSVEIAGPEVQAVIVLDKGRLVRVDSVIIHGDLTVRKSYLSNQLGIKEGSLYSEKAVRQIPSRLSAVRFLVQVRPPMVVFEEDLTKVHLYLNKRQASSFDGVIGFLPNPESNSILITGEVKLHLENALKQGEIMDLQWRKLQTNTQDLDLTLVSPYILNSAFSVDGRLKIYRRDTLFSDVFGQAGLRYSFGSGDYFRFFADRQSTSLISVIQYQNMNTVPPYLDRRVNSYGTGVFIENIDDRINPSRGVGLEAEVAVGTKEVIRNDRIPERLYEDLDLKSTQWRGKLTSAYYLRIVPRLIWHQQAIAASISNRFLFNNEASRIGGLKTIRGFNEESIFATTFTIVRSELRYQIDKEGYLFGFFDGAWYENTSINKIGARRDTPYGFGAGITFGTQAGVFSLSYALGSEQGNPILIAASKVHFGFISLF